MLTLIPLLLALVAVAALAAAGYAIVADQRRREIIGRAGSYTPPPPKSTVLIARRDEGGGFLAMLRSSADRWLPTSWMHDEGPRQRLIRAGFDGDGPAAVFAVARALSLIVVPLLALSLSGRGQADIMLYLIGGIAAGWVIPQGALDRLVRQRQERIRRAVPDAMDLLLICVEAGVSFDGALQRVARELGGVYPDLAEELSTVVRRVNAGVTREEALRGLYDRTGVEELRAIVANIVQSERWGTSMSRMLRITAETLRRKRKQDAEKRAQTAPLKMTVPLVLFILPALFVTILGPSGLALMEALRATQ